MKIAVIPARGGSKRIPRKNIKEFNGVPVIAYAINAAIKSHLFDRIIVSTDDSEIALVAKKYGAEIPFIRPPELADDHTPTVPVVAHALHELQTMGCFPSYICCIYPAVPFIYIEDIVLSHEIFLKSKASYCYPITEFPSAIQRALKRLSDGSIQPIYPEYEWTRTQDLETSYYDAGQFYWGKASAWLAGHGLQNHGLGYIIPQWRVVDIDTNEDWDRAEIIFASVKLSGVNIGLS